MYQKKSFVWDRKYKRTVRLLRLILFQVFAVRLQHNLIQFFKKIPS